MSKIERQKLNHRVPNSPSQPHRSLCLTRPFCWASHGPVFAKHVQRREGVNLAKVAPTPHLLTLDDVCLLRRADLSTPLRMEVSSFLSQNIFGHIDLFKNADPTVTCALLGELRPIRLQQSERLFKAGDLVRPPLAARHVQGLTVLTLALRSFALNLGLFVVVCGRPGARNVRADRGHSERRLGDGRWYAVADEGRLILRRATGQLLIM